MIRKIWLSNRSASFNYLLFALIILAASVLFLVLPPYIPAEEAPASVGRPAEQVQAQSQKALAELEKPKKKWLERAQDGGAGVIDELKQAPGWIEDKFIDWIDWKQRVDVSFDPRNPEKWRKKRDYVWGHGPKLQLSDLQPGDVLIYESGGGWNQGIDAVTGGWGASHAAIFIGNDKIIEADRGLGGIVESDITRLKNRKFIVRRASHVDGTKIRDWAKTQVDAPYNLVPWLKYADDFFDPGRNQNFNCSELVNQAYRSQGIFLRTGDDFVTPNDLLRPSTKYLQDVGWSEV